MKSVNFEQKLNLLIIVLSLSSQLPMVAGALSQAAKRGASATWQAGQRLGSQAQTTAAQGARGISTATTSRVAPKVNQGTRSFSSQVPTSEELVFGASKVPTYGSKFGYEKPVVARSQFDKLLAEQQKATDSSTIKQYEGLIAAERARMKEREQEEQALIKLHEEAKNQTLWARFVMWLRSYKK